MIFLNIFVPFLIAILYGSLLYGPSLLICALIPRRMASLRHAVLAASFVANLAIPAFLALYHPRDVRITTFARPLVDNESPIPATALPHATTQNVSKSLLPPSLRPNWAPLLETVAYSKLGLYCWFGLGYLASLLFLMRSKRWERDRRARISGFVKTPVTFWFLRSVIILPTVAEEWSEGRVKRVIAHEEAHGRRGDWFWQAFGNLAVAQNAVNPLAWVVFRKMRCEAECAADQAALWTQEGATQYASDLLEIAKQARRPANATLVAMTSSGDLRRRIKLILEGPKPAVGEPLVAGAAALGVACWASGAMVFSPAVASMIPGAGPLQQAIDGVPEQFPGQLSAWRADVRSGKTTPAKLSNGWNGLTANGIHVRLVGIFWGDQNGTTFRTPDGFAVNPPTRAPRSISGHEGRMDLLFAIPSDEIPREAEGMAGSSSFHDFSREPATFGFDGGYDEISGDGKLHYFHSLHSILDRRVYMPRVDRNSRPMATEFSVCFEYDAPTGEVDAVPLASVFAGRTIDLKHASVQLGHHIEAEDQRRATPGVPQIPPGGFALRLIGPADPVDDVSYRLVLSDQADGSGGIGSHVGWPSAGRGYQGFQFWFPAEAKSKKYAVLTAHGSHGVEFLEIPIPGS